MNPGLQAHIGLQLLSAYITGHDDDEAKRHFNALVLRLQVLEGESQRQATTTFDEYGNITIGLRPLGILAEAVPAQKAR